MRRLLVLAVALTLSAVVPATVFAARSWELTATPVTFEAGAVTSVHLTARNLSTSGSGITCIQVQVHPSFTISTVAVVSIKGQTSGAGFLSWTPVWTGGQTVAFKSPLKTSKLNVGDEAVFQVTGSDSTIGSMAWAGNAADDPGLPISTSCPATGYSAATVHFTVGPTPTPTPTPTPAPTPTPTPTPAPTASAQPSATPAPTAGSTSGPGSTPGPGATPVPSASPGASSVPSATPGSTGEPSAAPVEPLPSPGNGSPGPAGGFEIGNGGGHTGAIPIDGLDGAVMTALNGLPGGVLAWGFPAFALTVPGLLVILAVGAQALGALAWLPLVRRRLGGFGFRRRRET